MIICVVDMSTDPVLLEKAKVYYEMLNRLLTNHKVRVEYMNACTERIGYDKFFVINNEEGVTTRDVIPHEDYYEMFLAILSEVKYDGPIGVVFEILNPTCRSYEGDLLWSKLLPPKPLSMLELISSTLPRS